MALRLHEIHPMFIHLPLVLWPTALAVDGIARGRPGSELRAAGKALTAAAALGTVATGVAGLIAQEGVELHDDAAHDRLVTHRNIGIAFVAASLGLVTWRLRREPGLAYLVAGAVAYGLVSLGAYFGGELVYKSGAGVRAAHGVRAGASPALWPTRPGWIARTSIHHVGKATRHAIEHLREGEIAPALGQKITERGGETGQSAD